jgi:hypothetical protein
MNFASTNGALKLSGQHGYREPSALNWLVERIVVIDGSPTGTAARSPEICGIKAKRDCGALM